MPDNEVFKINRLLFFFLMKKVVIVKDQKNHKPRPIETFRNIEIIAKIKVYKHSMYYLVTFRPSKIIQR